MDSIKRDIKNEIVIEKVNLVRATLNEAYLMKDNLLEDGLDYKKIIVDLSSCDYIDSTFLGALIYSYRKIKEQDGEILLVVGNQGLTNSFIFREISSIFKVCNSIREAMEEMNNCSTEILSDKN
ncbi:MAG: STAS domain-containing protein [Ignavibacteriaceae bacterium]